MKTGVELIAEERQRQVIEEEWTAEHDDQWVNGELAQAAVCYAINHTTLRQSITWENWPWALGYRKPKDPIRDLVRAGALIAAEIDRLQRIDQ